MPNTFLCNADEPVVQTTAGKLRGYQFNGTYIFKGVKYATAKRFMQPVPVEPLEGIKDATSFGFVCPLMNKETPNGEVMVPHAYWPQDENCQNLNIWTQHLCEKAKKPVLVWLHGGGFSAGSAIEQVAYDGNNMSREGDVVVVTVNHRLNILGYLDLEPFGEKYKNSANAGSADLVAALQWIHDNIAKFGGDPENVTIFGQSGGGMKVTSLMQMPAADGLFHKGIVMSGVAGAEMGSPKDQNGTEIVTAILKELGLETSEIEKLETIPYPQLCEAYGKVAPAIRAKGGYVGCSPMINDYYLGEPHLEGFREHSKTIPLMVGTVISEFGFMPTGFNKYEMSEQDMKDVLGKRFGAENVDKLIELFAEAYPGKLPVDMLFLDSMFRPSSKDLVRKKAQYTEAPTYSYLFAFEFPYEHGKPAWHCSDIAFFFHNIDLVPVANVPGVSDKLQEQIFQAVMNFARTGNPNHPELPEWPVCKPDDEATMIFDRTCEVRHNFDDKLLPFHASVTPKFRFGAEEGNNVQH